jgi:hypothetical protein
MMYAALYRSHALCTDLPRSSSNEQPTSTRLWMAVVTPTLRDPTDHTARHQNEESRPAPVSLLRSRSRSPTKSKYVVSPSATGLTRLTTSQRRREQNRSSQRAYRERKERHQRELEAQINDWRQKHQLLSRSYSQQNDEVRKLKAQIEHLTTEISALQNGLPNLCGTLNQSPTEFDLVPFFDPGTPQ